MAIKKPPRAKKYKVDEDQLLKLSQLHTTDRDLLLWFDIPAATSMNYWNDNPHYRAIIDKGRSMTRQKLKQKALQIAMSDEKGVYSDTMLIFCLKNICGWTNNDNKIVTDEGQQMAANEFGFNIQVIPNKAPPVIEEGSDESA